jgi:hypothetical protein
MRVAACFVGHLRTYDKTAERWHQHLLDIKSYNVDVYVHTYKDRGFFKSHNDDKSVGDKDNGLIDTAELHKLYQPVSVIVEDQESIERLVSIPEYYSSYVNSLHIPTYFPLRTYWMFKKRQRALQSIQLELYDRVILTRFDIQAPHFNFVPQVVNTGNPPNNQGWTQDFCLYGQPDLIQKSINGYDEYVKTSIDQGKPLEEILDPHMIWGRLLQNLPDVDHNRSVMHNNIVR